MPATQKFAIILRRPLLLLIFVFYSFSSYSQILSVCSWNLKNFGQSKSEKEMILIAKLLKSFDVVAIQEVVAGPAGPRAVARLADELNRTGQQWAYSISPPTSGNSYQSERYAFIWKKAKVKQIGEARLEPKYAFEIEREPYLGRFLFTKKIFTLVNFHAVPKNKKPETEVKYFKFFPDLYAQENLVFCGDFNLPQSHTVFNPLRKMGYLSSMVDQKTSLKTKCVEEDCLSAEYDNFYFNPLRVKHVSAGILHFYKAFTDLKAARLISDHVPVYFNFSLN